MIYLYYNSSEPSSSRCTYPSLLELYSFVELTKLNPVLFGVDSADRSSTAEDWWEGHEARAAGENGQAGKLEKRVEALGK